MLVLGASRQSTLNFRIGFLSSIGGRLPYPCLPTPFPILRYKGFFWKKGSCVTFGFLALTFLSLLLLPVAALRAFVFKCDARNGPLLHHTRFQNPAPLNPSKGRPQCGNLRENFWQNAEIVGNCVSHILDVNWGFPNGGFCEGGKSQ